MRNIMIDESKCLVCAIHHSPLTITINEKYKIEYWFVDTEFHELDDLRIFPKQEDVDSIFKDYYSRYYDFIFDGTETAEDFIRYKYKSLDEQEYIYIDFYFEPI